MRMFALLAAACLAAPMAAHAQEVISVDKFTAVELHGGGRIIVRQGPVQKVTLVRGDSRVAEFRVRGDTLVISPCRGVCFGSHDLDVEIEAPALNGAAILGGGEIVARGTFPAQGAVSTSIKGGGDIDMRAVPAQAASARVLGGGKILLAAHDSLAASIFGGGEIRYAGRPAVNSSVHGGGAVSQID
jgi:hypothetical protein